MRDLHVWAGCGFLKQSDYDFIKTFSFCIWFIDAYPIFYILHLFFFPPLLLLNYTPLELKGRPAVMEEH